MMKGKADECIYENDNVCTICQMPNYHQWGFNSSGSLKFHRKFWDMSFVYPNETSIDNSQITTFK